MKHISANLLRFRIPQPAAAGLAVVVFGLLAAAALPGCAGGSGGVSPASGGSTGSGGGGRGMGSGGRAAGTGGEGQSGASGAGTGGRDSGAGGLTGGGGNTGTGGLSGATGSGGGGLGAGTGGGGSRANGCGDSSLLFCDDFESMQSGAVPGAPRWTTAFNGMATITIDGTTPAHSGSRSVHVKTSGSYQAFLVLSNAVTFPARLYFRTFIRLGAPMTSGHNTYFKSGAAATSSSEHETRIGVMNAMLMINQPASDRGALSNQKYYTDGNKPGVVFAPQSWVCVEVLADPPHSEIDVWVDGKEVPDLHLTDWQQDPVQALRFGFEKYAGPDADIWYDDIAVSAQPIGCN
ncbi:MAG: hypothetical protein ABIS92_10115 [Polyangia bacterium]